eukprot:5608184-Pleurochrysis_carterae.AAC.1
MYLDAQRRVSVRQIFLQNKLTPPVDHTSTTDPAPTAQPPSVAATTNHHVTNRFYTTGPPV